MKSIERAARSLAEFDHQPAYASGSSAYSPEEFADLYWRSYTAQARVVLEALRQPCDAMLRAGGIAVSNKDRDRENTAEDVASFWQAMINAALSDAVASATGKSGVGIGAPSATFSE